MRWRNLSFGVLIVTFFGAGVAIFVLASQVSMLNEKLADARSNMIAAQRSAEGLTEGASETAAELEAAEEELDSAQDEIRALSERLRARRQAVRSSLDCGSRPHVELVPESGQVGTRVTVIADCITDDWNDGFGVFLTRQFTQPRDCELIVGRLVGNLGVQGGRGRGTFLVEPSGACFQESYRRRVAPGVYRVGVGCRGCIVDARFRVTGR